MKKLILMLVAVGMVGSAAQAANFFWRADAAGVNNDWSTAANWGIDNAPPSLVAPGAGDTAYLIDVDGSSPTNVNAPGAVAHTVQIGLNWGFEGTLNVNAGGDLTVSDNAFVNWDQEQNAALNLNGGVIDITAALHVGSTDPTKEGRVTVNSGTLNAGQINMSIWGTSNGYLDINGGEVNTGVFAFDIGSKTTINGGKLVMGDISIAGGAAPDRIDIHGGELQILGDRAADFLWWAEPAQGIVTAYGGTGQILASFDDLTGYTTVTASTVPEPATMTLLALGSIAAIKRRRRA